MNRSYTVGAALLVVTGLLILALRGCGPARPTHVERAAVDLGARQADTDDAENVLDLSLADVQSELAALRVSVDEFAAEVDRAAREAERSGSSAYLAATRDVAVAPADARGYVRLPVPQQTLCDTYSRGAGRAGC